MSAPVLGIDSAIQEFDAAQLRGKLRHKSCKNSTEGSGFCPRRFGSKARRLHACLEATGSYGEELATLFFYEAGHTVSVVNPARVKGFAQSELILYENRQD